jgi:hypothetical protein
VERSNLGRKTMFERGNGEFTITGVVVEAFWDDTAMTMRGAIVTDDDVAYLIKPDDIGRQLVTHVRDRVVAKGHWDVDATGRLAFRVDDVRVVNSPGRLEVLEWDPWLNDNERIGEDRHMVREVNEGWPVQ